MESSENVGFSYEHVMQTFLSTSAAYVIPVIACSVLTYFMVFTSYNWWRFVLVTITSLVLNQTWIAVYMLATYITPSNAYHASDFIAALGGFSGGFIVTWSQMPIGWVMGYLVKHCCLTYFKSDWLANVFFYFFLSKEEEFLGLK